MSNQGEPSGAHLIKSINKYDGTNSLEQKRNTLAIISLTHSGIADSIDGGIRPTGSSDDVKRIQDAESTPIPSPIENRSTDHQLHTSRTSSPSEGAADARRRLEDPAGGAVDFSREETQVRAIVNKAEIENWDLYNKQSFNFLRPSGYFSSTLRAERSQKTKPQNCSGRSGRQVPKFSGNKDAVISCGNWTS